MLASSWIVFVYALVVTVGSMLNSVEGSGPEEIQNTTYTHPCEIVLVLDFSGSVSPESIDKMINVVRIFPKYFPISETNTRVGVIVYDTESTVALPLSSDPKKVAAVSKTIPGGGWTRTDLAFIDVKDKMFNNARPNALKIVILITDGVPSDSDLPRPQVVPRMMQVTEEAAGRLKDDGALIYVVFVGKNYHEDQDVPGHVEKVAGDKSRVFPIADFDQLKEKLFADVIEAIVCHRNRTCRFIDVSRTSCLPIWYRPFVSNANCTVPFPKEPLKPCSMDECVKLCADWEWKLVDCASHNGQVEIGRAQRKPDQYRDIYENCEQSKLVYCPTWSTSTTATATTPKTTRATTRATTTTTTTKKRPTTTTPTTSTTKTSPSTTTSSTTTTPRIKPTKSTTTTTERTISSTEKKAKSDDEATSSSGIQSWHYIIIAVVLCLLLILVGILVFVIVRRRKSKRKKRHAGAEPRAAHRRGRNRSPRTKSPPNRPPRHETPRRISPRPDRSPARPPSRRSTDRSRAAAKPTSVKTASRKSRTARSISTVDQRRR